MSSKKWFILKTESQLNKLKKLLKEYPFLELSGESVFVRLGYKNISLGDKETYYLLRDLTMLSKSQYKMDEVNVSLDFLSKCLDTSIRAQSTRIQNIENAGLICVTRRKYHANTYLVNVQPLPDSTFVSTVILLIRRKKIFKLIENYKETTDIFEKKIILKQLYDFNENPFYKNIVDKMPKIKEILKDL